MTASQQSGIIVYIPLPSLSASRTRALQLISHASGLAQHQLRIILSCPDIAANASTPRRVWQVLQGLVADFYISASTVAYTCNNPLLNVDIIFEGYCGYDAWIDYGGLEGGFDAVLCDDQAVLSEANKKRQSAGLPAFESLELEPETSKTNETPSVTTNSQEFYHRGSNPPDIYDHIAMGGTFDHLHSGHKILLTIAAWLSRLSLFCGVVSPDLLKNKKGAALLEPIDTRISNCNTFLYRFKRGGDLVFDVAQINDPYGPPQDNPKYSAIVGSLETLKGCEAVNDMRIKNGLGDNLLDIYVIDVISKNSRVGQKDMDTKLSSTFIRNYLQQHNETANQKLELTK
ncbi:hypothetical protein SmJEL517_g00060 [Synchytrium microbalum]|uniref:Cytidyltransferase-like domain-containing protein n=1 Tax=Synchytrium microbalum TaxID=1806994 RepID=A0A507CEY9_9FUNG|nr:uncharacterized protein SmJEL517_g00060 [Synchytrium microbalum]TPX38051.1 hypothetical protein SmJEL517_g00060 [Synchytrium microbalum]